MNIDKNFYDVNTIILNRNYRSTQTILDSANKLIAHNKFRVPKDLYTENEKGEEIFQGIQVLMIFHYIFEF